MSTDTNTTALPAIPPDHWDRWALERSRRLVAEMERTNHPRAQLVARIHCLLVEAMGFAAPEALATDSQKSSPEQRLQAENERMRAALVKLRNSFDPDDWAGDQRMIDVADEALGGTVAAQPTLTGDQAIERIRECHETLTTWLNAFTLDRCGCVHFPSQVETWARQIMEGMPYVPGPGADEMHPDDVAVDRFAAAMKEKLAQARAKGRGGWADPAQCSVETLARMLVEHVRKGDPRDVGNFAMMLWARGAGPEVLAAATAAQPGMPAHVAGTPIAPLLAETLRQIRDDIVAGNDLGDWRYVIDGLLPPGWQAAATAAQQQAPEGYALMPAEWTDAMEAEFLRHHSEPLTPKERQRARWRRLVAAFGMAPAGATVGAYACAKRAADPGNESAACRPWCGNAQTCMRSAPVDKGASPHAQIAQASQPVDQGGARG